MPSCPYTNSFYMQDDSLLDSMSSLRLPSPSLPMPHTSAEQKRTNRQKSSTDTMGSRREGTRPDWIPDWAMVGRSTRTNSSKKSKMLDPIDTSHVDTSRRYQYQPYRPPSNDTAHTNEPITYKPYRGKPTKAPSYSPEVSMPAFTYRVTEDTSAASPRNPRRMSFEFDTLDDSILVGQSYHRMKEKSHEEKSSTNKRSRNIVWNRTVSEARPFNNERWTPSPPSSLEGIQDDDSPVSPFLDATPSSENGSPGCAPSPVFRPMLEKFHSLERQQYQQRESEHLVNSNYNNQDTSVNFSRKTTVRKNSQVKEQAKMPEVRPATPVYISYVDVNIRGDDESVVDAFSSEPRAKKTQMNKEKSKKKCPVM